MALSNNDTQILEQIASLEGKCMDSQRCKLCPFRTICLPEFCHPNPPTEEKRAKMALDVLTHHALVDEQEPLDIDQYRWDQR